jgi:hypothetical protein
VQESPFWLIDFREKQVPVKLAHFRGGGSQHCRSHYASPAFHIRSLLEIPDPVQNDLIDS